MPIKEPVVIAREVLKDLQAIFGENLLSVALFGSAARGTYDPKRSDINLVIVLKGDVRPSLSSFWKYVSKWRKLDLAVPVVMNEQFLSSSLDTFAAKFSFLARDLSALTASSFSKIDKSSPNLWQINRESSESSLGGFSSRIIMLARNRVASEEILLFIMLYSASFLPSEFMKREDNAIIFCLSSFST